MLHWITIDNIQDFLNDNGIWYYMNWENWKIEIEINQIDARYEKKRAEMALKIYRWQTKQYELVWISGGLNPMPK